MKDQALFIYFLNTIVETFSKTEYQPVKSDNGVWKTGVLKYDLITLWKVTP